MARIAQITFFTAYALGYFFNVGVPHNLGGLITALAAAVIALLLIVDDRNSLLR